jgi:hypothetical protein
LNADTEIRAVLTQTSNTLLYRPDPQGAEWLYDPAKGSAEAILRDLRGDQQTVLSHASPRPSADPMETIVLRTEYADGRYGTFEGTGAISSWTLSFPGDEIDAKHIRDQIDDIEIRLDYAAAWGGTEFKEKVDSLLEATRTGSQTPPGPSESTGDTSAHTPPPAPALTYPAPVVREVRARHAIDRRDVPDGATVTVVPWPSIREGQQVWLRCMGTRADGTSLNRALRSPSTPVTADETTQGIEATIPLDYLEALGDYAQLRVVCKVSLDGTGASSTSTAFPELTLDVPKCVTLSVTTAVTDEDWVPHTSPPAPWTRAHAGYLAVSEQEGPTILTQTPPSPTSLQATVVAWDTDVEYAVALKARRLPQGGGSFGMNSFINAKGDPASQATYLRIQCLASDNADLPPGRYKGRLVLHLTQTKETRVIESLFIDIDLTVAPSIPEPLPEPEPEHPPIDVPPPTATYPTPVVPQVRARNALDRRDIANGATITLAAWPGIREGQRIWLRCEGTKADASASNRDLFPSPRTVTAAEVTAGINVPLPFDYVDGLGDYAQLRIFFKAALGGGTDEATAVSFPVLALDIPKCVTLSISTAAPGSSVPWVEHKSSATPWIPTHAGYLTLSEEEGPTALAWQPPAHTFLKATLLPQNGGSAQTFTLRATRISRGGNCGMNDYDKLDPAATYSSRTTLQIHYRTADNLDPPAGAYKGQLVIQMVGHQVPRVIESIFLGIDITQ